MSKEKSNPLCGPHLAELRYLLVVKPIQRAVLQIFPSIPPAPQSLKNKLASLNRKNFNNIGWSCVGDATNAKPPAISRRPQRASARYHCCQFACSSSLKRTQMQRVILTSHIAADNLSTIMAMIQGQHIYKLDHRVFQLKIVHVTGTSWKLDHVRFLL